jgi:hypothetical protein
LGKKFPKVPESYQLSVSQVVEHGSEVGRLAVDQVGAGFVLTKNWEHLKEFRHWELNFKK